MDDDGGPSQNNNTSLPVTLDDEIVNTSQAAETATSHVLREDAKSPEKDKHRLTKTVCLYLTELGLVSYLEEDLNTVTHNIITLTL